MKKAQVTLGLIDELLKPESPLQFRFNQLTEELAETARSVRALLDQQFSVNEIYTGKKRQTPRLSCPNASIGHPELNLPWIPAKTMRE